MRKKILQGLTFGNVEVSGYSVKYNQLFYNFRMESYSSFPFTQNGITFSYENGIIILNGTSTANINIVAYGNILKDHKYFRRNLKSNAFGLYSHYEIDNESIEKAKNNDSYLSITILANRTFNNTKYLGMCIDLTTLFGAGNEPSTLEAFYQTDVGQLVQKGVYLPYSPENTILSATSPFRFAGDNLFYLSNIHLFNKQYAVYDINVLENWVGEYTLSWKTENNNNFAIQGINGASFATKYTRQGATIQLNGVGTIRIYLNDNVENISMQDIMLTEGSSPKPYAKYINRTFTPTNEIVLRKVNNIVETWNNCSGKVKRKLGIVDLGTLEYTYYPNYSSFVSLSINDIVNVPYYLSKDVLLCSKYKISDKWWSDSAKENESISLGSYPSIVIKDSSYTSANDFKQAMSGVYLVYEKATPTTETTESIALPKGITHIYDKYGVELNFTKKEY